MARGEDISFPTIGFEVSGEESSESENDEDEECHNNNRNKKQKELRLLADEPYYTSKF
jgi:hypothetical protein